MHESTTARPDRSFTATHAGGRRAILRVVLGFAAAVAAAAAAAGQSPIAVNDAFTARSGILLQVEAPGVMENDFDFGAEPPPPAAAVASLVSPASFGLLVLNGDGSFDYTSNVGFSGVDTFSYSFVDSTGTSNVATVAITVNGCEAGVAPTQWVCWVEGAYLAKVAELGLSTLSEGFEDDATWVAARSPDTVPSVLSRGITWASNFSFNNITTGYGAAHSGNWGVYSLPHGDQSGPFGTPIHDGFTGTASSPDALLGVGGWLVGSQIGSSADLVVSYDGGATVTANFPDHTLDYSHKFFGFIDTAGFTSFEVVETNGTVGQPFFVLGDDFSIVQSGVDSTPPRVVEVGSWEDTGDGVLSDGEVTDVLITQLMVRFSETVQDLPGDSEPDDVTNPANYLLFDDGGDGFDTVDCAGGIAIGDHQIPLTVWSYTSGNPSETLLEVNGGLELPVGVYRLLVCGTTSIVDWAGNVLDGDGNGTGGDDFVRNFEISGPINSAPTADPQSVSTAEDTGLGIILTGSDPDGDPMSFAIATGPSHGVLTGTPPSVTYTPGPNYFGPDSFTFTATDGVLTSAPATVSITVTAVNDVPLAVDDGAATDEDVAVSIAVLTNDAIGDPPTTITAVTQGTSGSVAIDPGATSVSYTPNLNFHGGDSFSYTITDLDGETSTATVAMTVNPVNDTPVAADDSAATDEDVAISIAVLTNDALGDEPATITAVTQGTSGSVAIDPGATSVSYTPNLNFHGGDSFSYTITDLDGETSTATVAMTVNPVNDAPTADAGPDQTVFVTDTVTLDGSGSSDVDGDTLSYAWTLTAVPVGSGAALSSATAVMPTFVVDLPGDYVAELIVSDGALFSLADTVTISTTNSAPVANAGPDQSAFVTDTVFLDGSGSSDVDGDPLTYAWSFFSVPAGSAAALSSLTAEMPTFVVDLPGTYVVQLIVNDGVVSSAPDTVLISTDNSAPVANAGPDQSAFVTDTVTLDGSGSSDADGDPLTYAWSFTSRPPGSAAALNDPTAEMPTFVVDLPGDYVVQLIVWDGTVFSTPDTVRISTTNSAPTADPQSVSTAEDTGLGIVLTGSDPDGDPMSFAIATGPSHGVLTGTPPSVTYTPGPNYFGPDSFTFTATDGVLTSAPATVSITVTAVNDVPLAVDDGAATDEDVAVSIAVLTNDAIGDPPTTITAVTQGTSGSVAIDPGATSVSYTPNLNFHGGDSFSYTITDLDGETSTATVTMTINPVNDTPVAADDSAATDEDVAISIAVLVNDAIGDPPTTITVVTQGASGSVAIDPGAATVSYTPDPNFHGLDSFSYTITDLDGETSTATVAMTVNPVNDAPTADDQSVSTPENTALAITLTGGDVDGDVLSYAIEAGPAHGVLTGTPPDVLYSPDTNYIGPDGFTFTAHDGLLNSTPATVSITVTANGLPVLTIGDANVSESDTGTTNVTVLVSLSEPSPISITVDFATADGSAVAGLDYVAASGTLTIPALATSHDLILEVIGDLIDEPDETFSVSLSNPVGATLGTPSSGAVTIIDNDPRTWFVAPGGNDLNDCLTAATACLTISEAVSRAIDDDVINVARGVYAEQLVLPVNLTLMGELPLGTVIDGGGTGVVVDVSPTTTIMMSGFEVRNGATGGIANQGDLTIEDCWVHDNGNGLPSSFGGIDNQGTALIDRVAVSNNLGDTAGGVSNSGQLTIVNSTIAGNQSSGGPGIDNHPGASLDLVYSTVAGNGSLGIRVGGITTMRGTIIAGHGTANCDAGVATLGHNLEDADTCGLQIAGGDLIGVDPLLAPLGYHGGSSPTLAITIESPAVDAAESVGAPATDQRFVVRPLDGDLDGTAMSDIGAFEAIPGVLFDDGFESGDTSTWSSSN